MATPAACDVNHRFSGKRKPAISDQVPRLRDETLSAAVTLLTPLRYPTMTARIRAGDVWEPTSKMKTRHFRAENLRSISMLLAAASVLLFAGAEANDEKRWTAEQQEIIALLENGPMGIETDFEAWEDEFHDDWTVWFVGQPEVRAKPGHMAGVRDYIGRGAKVISYTAQFADIAVNGDTAVARFNAIEKLQNPDGSPRTVNYASTDFLVKVDGEWKIRTTTVAHLPEEESAPEPRG